MVDTAADGAPSEQRVALSVSYRFSSVAKEGTPATSHSPAGRASPGERRNQRRRPLSPRDFSEHRSSGWLWADGVQSPATGQGQQARSDGRLEWRRRRRNDANHDLRNHHPAPLRPRHSAAASARSPPGRRGLNARTAAAAARRVLRRSRLLQRSAPLRLRLKDLRLLLRGKQREEWQNHNARSRRRRSLQLLQMPTESGAPLRNRPAAHPRLFVTSL